MRFATTLRYAGAAALLGALLAACAPPSAPPATVEAPPAFPAAHYRQIEAQGGKVLRIDPQRSLLTVDVGRDGTLARLGHDHVVASHDLHGYVALAEGRSDLYVPLARLVVDEPDLRAAAGLAAPLPPPEAIAATTRNMLGSVLDAERFPFALIAVRRSTADGARLNVAITLRGTTRAFDVPVHIDTLPGGIEASGRLSFKQSDFGIAPMSVLGGALQVRDRLDLRFRIAAAGG